MTLRTRLQKLENAAPSVRTVYMLKWKSETHEQAKARWRVKNPGQDLDDPSLRIMFLVWGDPQ